MAAAFEQKGAAGGFSLQPGQSIQSGRGSTQAAGTGQAAGSPRAGRGGPSGSGSPNGQYGQNGEKPLTGLPAKLAALEEKLPAVLQKRAAAGALCAVMLLASVFGLGGAKLAAYRAKTDMMYVVAADRYSTSIVDELDAAAAAAVTITDLCAQQLGEEDAGVQAARAAIAQRRQRPAGSGPAYDYQANLALQSAVSYLYNSVRHDMDGTAGQALQGQWSDFTSCQDRITRSGFNAAVDEYNQTAGSFPANLIGALWGAEELERFG